MNLLVFVGLFLPIIISGLSVLFFKINNKLLKLFTSFSGAYLLSLCFAHIIPEIFSQESEIHLGIFVLIGFLIQLLMDFITKGIEHGHQDINCDKGNSQGTMPLIAILVGICIHSFLEGMPLANMFNQPTIQRTMLFGIIIHNIPISIILMILFIQSKMSKIKSIIFLLFFALSAPLGIITLTITNNYLLIVENKKLFRIIMAMVVGILLHISTTILFESDEQHNFNFYKFISILLGGILPFAL